MDSKPWYQSKTIIFNIVSAIVMVALSFTKPEATSNPHVQEVAASIVTIGNIVLRFITNKPIDGSPQ